MKFRNTWRKAEDERNEVSGYTLYKWNLTAPFISPGCLSKLPVVVGLAALKSIPLITSKKVGFSLPQNWKMEITFWFVILTANHIKSCISFSKSKVQKQHHGENNSHFESNSHENHIWHTWVHCHLESDKNKKRSVLLVPMCKYFGFRFWRNFHTDN